MANSGCTSFEDIANKLNTEIGKRYSAKEIERIRKIGALIPMLNDVVSVFQADTTNYPEGVNLKPLDVAFSLVGHIISDV